jgi:hypothetical protein
MARFDPTEVVFDFVKTERNGPIQDFLTEILGEAPLPSCTVAPANLRFPIDQVPTPQEAIYG